jgi:hypothetical protein
LDPQESKGIVEPVGVLERLMLFIKPSKRLAVLASPDYPSPGFCLKSNHPRDKVLAAQGIHKPPVGLLLVSQFHGASPVRPVQMRRAALANSIMLCNSLLVIALFLPSLSV